MSLLVAEGQPDAARYPVCILWTEATIARQRINSHHVTQALLVQGAIMSVWGGAKEFGKMIKGLSDGDE